MAKTGRATAAFALVVAAAAPLQAQTTIDVSRITCKQFLANQVADPDYIAIWLSGYYNSRRNNTVVGVQTLKENNQRLRRLCVSKPDALLMKVVEDPTDAR